MYGKIKKNVHRNDFLLRFLSDNMSGVLSSLYRRQYFEFDKNINVVFTYVTFHEVTVFRFSEDFLFFFFKKKGGNPLLNELQFKAMNDPIHGF